jgi:hypothetical protein
MGNGAIENYMTLSHCWGKADTYKLTSETASHLRAGLRISLLPRTFQRTIDVVRSLGTKYLWIDSLCIIQNSTADWEQESAQMGQVYSNGLLNIAATGSTDGEGGLLRERPSKLPLESTACYVSPSWKDHCNSNLLVHRSSLPSRMLLDGPLLSRGWVLQERIMAKRILHFGKSQLYWECNEHDCCEIYPTGIPELWTRPTSGGFSKRNIPDLFIEYGSNFGVITTVDSDTLSASITQTPSELTDDAAASLRRSTLEVKGDTLALTTSPTPAAFQRLATEFWNASPTQARIFVEGVISRGEEQSFLNGVESQEQAIDFWNCVVSIYSRCELTFEKDKLVALAGVARALKVQMGCDYLAGMWRIELERNLLWSVESKFTRPEEDRAPSWSWASVDGEIKMPERRSRFEDEVVKDEAEIEILRVSTQKKSADEMGQVKGGALTVRGPLMTCFVQRTDDFGGFLPSEVAEDYDSEDDDDLPAYFIRINGVWGEGVLSIDAHEPFDTSLKTKLYCLPIMKGKGLMDDDSCRCLVLERTTKEPGVFKRRGTLLFFHAAHNIDADNGWMAWNAWEPCGGVIVNEEWFDGGEADADGKYTITII